VPKGRSYMKGWLDRFVRVGFGVCLLMALYEIPWFKNEIVSTGLSGAIGAWVFFLLSLKIGKLAKNPSTKKVLPLALLILCVARPAWAVRPFITDDARVVGYDNGQIETSLRIDKFKYQNLNLGAYGLTRNLEFTAGWVDGYLRKEFEERWSITGPLLQLKYLVVESKPLSYPGIAVAAGVTPPWGRGGLKPDDWGSFGFLALTETILDRDRLLVHGNLGISLTGTKGTFTWGKGTQVNVWKGLCVIGEVVSGDPYANNQNSGGAFQTGVRYLFSNNFQLDATYGSGLWGSPKPDSWVGFGLRIVFDSMLNRNPNKDFWRQKI